LISTENGNGRRRLFWYAGLTLPAAGLLAALLFGPIPRTLWNRQVTAVFDFGHFVLFAAVMLWLWIISRRNTGLSLCVSVAVAGICEAGQFFTGRTACVPDFWRGVLGVLFTIVIIHACGGARTFRQRVCHVILAVALAAWPVAEVLPALVDVCDKFHSSSARHSVDVSNGLPDCRPVEPHYVIENGTITGSSSPPAAIRRFRGAASCLRTSPSDGSPIRFFHL
jgi:hypothetical protein